ncbi:bifunctional DNA-formamidopyrimidine glycosylase/DNA-(apurinic or apyrimidinic site) lyase [Allorhizobium sp. BGMRC 0089]|uniref:bifunctional DNA-formamidopyrimidine glycosylase/DNA-(apurinic or apyrimidinic site) lyase n=1 Tax=Allorhizobium sonneratiae TaxID=2934936 RepID=UPI002033FE2D|nr:bifunctional DNA-formamidopyrimidine glycosylase/DNA-(apurinic or apyrimidinic site) lyase [Allorhizobium sonneratiae]MCM2291592.1 bifunctional DNA-formamidopyrimidine glycosylase/DNA-(apurinic or apyrimidinic site) lyase [Allorhizobium sonneratiae]
MPELPEVETVRRGLAPVMEAGLIERLELRRADLRFPLPEGLAGRVAGRRIVALSRRAKYLLIDLDDGFSILSHLGMSGSYRVEAGGDARQPGQFHMARSRDEKHDHVIFHLVAANGRPVRVIYNDPRRFGFMDILERRVMQEHPALGGLGPEPVGNGFDAAYLAGRFKSKAQPLKAALLDQRTIAGLGNIYVCEALWRAGLSPQTPAGMLVGKAGEPLPALVLLSDAIRAVIDEAIAAGGSTLRDHIRADGSLGYFQHSFNVYDREGQDCRTPGCTGKVERILQSGRSTFHCARCQR